MSWVHIAIELAAIALALLAFAGIAKKSKDPMHVVSGQQRAWFPLRRPCHPYDTDSYTCCSRIRPAGLQVSGGDNRIHPPPHLYPHRCIRAVCECPPFRYVMQLIASKHILMRHSPPLCWFLSSRLLSTCYVVQVFKWRNSQIMLKQASYIDDRK